MPPQAVCLPVNCSMGASLPQPLMRADFTLFDEYQHTHGDAPPFAFPLTAFWGNRDRRIKQHLVQVGHRH